MVGGAEETLEEEEGLFMLLAVVEERDIVEHRCRHARNTTSLIRAHATCTVPADLNLRCTHRHGDERTWGMVRVGAQRAHVPDLCLGHVSALPVEESTQVCHGAHACGVDGDGLAIQALRAGHILSPHMHASTRVEQEGGIVVGRSVARVGPHGHLIHLVGASDVALDILEHVRAGGQGSQRRDGCTAAPAHALRSAVAWFRLAHLDGCQ